MLGRWSDTLLPWPLSLDVTLEQAVADPVGRYARIGNHNQYPLFSRRDAHGYR